MSATSHARSQSAQPDWLGRLPIPVALLTADGLIDWSNLAWKVLVGPTRGAALDETLAAGSVDRRGLAGAKTYAFRPQGEPTGELKWFRADETADLAGQRMVSLTDVTAEHRLADLRQANSMRDALMQEAEVGTWLYDPDTDLYYFSTELTLGHQQAADGVPTSTLQLIQHRDDGPKDRAIRDRLTTEGGTAASEMRYRDANGGWKHLRVHYRSGRKTPSGRFEMYGISQNVTEQAAAREAAVAATAAKSDFLASISHEIRTPMNGIVGILHLLKREPLSPEAMGLLDDALGCSTMLGQIINDVLDFSKIEAGKLDLSPIPTDPRALIDSVATLLKPQIEQKGLYLRIAAAEAGWRSVDPVRLSQCLFNTVGNAAKFTTEGGVSIRMSAPAPDRLRFEVEDTGIGIPEEAQGRLFDRFQQAEHGTTRKFGGTGLGLVISRSLVRMMGGDMGFESRPGAGSTFWFEVEAPTADALEADSLRTGDDAPLAGLRILVVDDNRVNRLVGVKTLEAMGAEAKAVESGPDAIEAVAVGGYDLVLMDVNMPGMDGLEATHILRGQEGSGGAIPIIAMTADVMPHQIARYEAAGMNGFVPKPFAPADLLREIARLSA